MNKPACSVDELELGRLLDGELTENGARRLREHVAQCGSCTARMAALAAVLDGLRAPVVGAHDAAFLHEVEQRLPRAAPVVRSRPRWAARLGAVGGLAMAAAAIVLVARPSQQLPPEFGARGGPAAWSDLVNVSLGIVGDGSAVRPVGAGARIAPGEGVLVEARNLDKKAVVHLMVFGIDAAGEIHWLAPSWLDPATSPVAVPLPPDGTRFAAAVLPERPAAGPFKLATLLTRVPLDVKTVEARVKAGQPLGQPGEHRLTFVEAEVGR